MKQICFIKQIRKQTKSINSLPWVFDHYYSKSHQIKKKYSVNNMYIHEKKYFCKKNKYFSASVEKIVNWHKRLETNHIHSILHIIFC